MTKLIAGGSGKDNMKKKKKEISRNMLRNDYLNNPLNVCVVVSFFHFNDC